MAETARDITSGFVRMHILHHAGKHAITGAWMREELGGHGYSISPGTLYPMLRAMERSGYLESRAVQDGPRRSREYTITKKGTAAARAAKARLSELCREVCGCACPHGSGPEKSRAPSIIGVAKRPRPT